MWSQEALEHCVAALEEGEVIAAPAEGVYGYCVDPFNADAVEKLMALKQRDPAKGVIVLVPHKAALVQVCGELSVEAQQAIETYWQPNQAPTTLLLPPAEDMPALLTGRFENIAVRWPQVEYMRVYVEAWGRPLVSTSLNRAGEPPAVTAAEIPAGVCALTLPEPLSGEPSRIFNPQTGAWIR